MGQQVNVYKKLKMFPGAVIEGALGPIFDTGGTTYYVNNITGSSTADGLSWNSAVSEVSRAVTLSEASRLIHPGGSTNDYIMNTIVVQGTGTAYSSISALPSYANIVGLGAEPRGNGAGIARLTSSSGATASGSTRGSNWYNIQFGGSGADYAMDIAVIFRSTFENCTFVNKSTAGMRIVTGGGVVIRECDFGGDTVATSYGLYIGDDTATKNFNQCLVVDNTFHGLTAAVFQSAYRTNNTRFTNNLAMGGTYGIRDNASNSEGIQFLVFYDKNFCYGDSSNNINDGGMKINITPLDRCIGNWCSDAGTGHWYAPVS